MSRKPLGSLRCNGWCLVIFLAGGGCDAAVVGGGDLVEIDLAAPIDLTAPASCTDRMANGGETDIDCGGSTTCPRCGAGKRCNGAADCRSGQCLNNACLGTCSDGEKNGGETDIDCGGSGCGKCVDGKACLDSKRDCTSGFCASGVCQAASCSDGKKNGEETAVDCGGPTCPRCIDGAECTTGTDCISSVCGKDLRCAAPTCTDGVRNGMEVDVDCGGSGTCPRCAAGKICTRADDCASVYCAGGACAACSASLQCTPAESCVSGVCTRKPVGWTPTSTTKAPAARYFHYAVWAGSRLFIWGGDSSSPYLRSGGLYDPVSNTWTSIDPTGAPDGVKYGCAVWTGSRVLVWGGYFAGGFSNTGGLYDPSTNTWQRISTANAPTPRNDPACTWTGTRLLAWGGYFQNTFYNDGGLYDPVTDSWTPTSTGADCPSPRQSASAVPLGGKVILWGGESGPGTIVFYNDGAWYDPGKDVWSRLPTANAPGPRGGAVAVSTGSKMIVWGGDNDAVVHTGGIFDPAGNGGAGQWKPITTAGAPTTGGSGTFGDHYGMFGAWTGTRLVVWGGHNPPQGGSLIQPNGFYDPATDTWSLMKDGNAPTGGYFGAGAWTGHQFIVWGGSCGLSCWNNTGAVYTPSPEQASN